MAGRDRAGSSSAVPLPRDVCLARRPRVSGAATCLLRGAVPWGLCPLAWGWGQEGSRLACGVGSPCCCGAAGEATLHLSLPALSPQAAGPFSGAEGLHAVPPRGGLLPGPGPHRRGAAHAHAGRGRSGERGGAGGQVLGSRHRFAPNFSRCERAPGVLCLPPWSIGVRWGLWGCPLRVPGR